ncbi:YkgJ family cysteine cluster protein [Carboxylicivirga caseinilyticus]|uniref:YkgJ family cysteine cluster protein n=1 Tax=Carboxylicivirga caseinilyticus TaxID=3417572 RepID=UPI003D34BA26|nr:YkgJ family cysteine cluster protein [Marinilabiliaceae bacterium A049]
MDENQMSEHDKVFFNDGLNLANDSLSNNTDKKTILHVTRQAQDAVDGLIDALGNEAKRQNIPVDCKKGCSWCCYQPIFATSHEMMFVWEFIKLNFKEEDQKMILQQAFNNYQKRGRMNDKELLASKMPCPLLLNGACSVYPARPITCRIYLSMSAESCKTFYDEPNKENSYPQLFEFPLQAGRMLNEGINKGLHNKDIKNREILIEEGLLLAHNNGEPDVNKINEIPLFVEPG